MSFAIIISEKGGQERREVFDKNEISIGRVQGNDLLLPKGNVSKRHARIVYRDGRFIVTDLKSTNGSYVNGHRIAQATIVREGDKIYIGDFILKVDAGASASGPLPSPRDGSDAPMAPQRSDSDAAGTPPRVSAVNLPPAEASGLSHIPLEQDPDDAGGMPHAPARALAPPPIDSRPPRPPAPIGGSTQASGSIDRTDRTSPPRAADRPPPPPPPPLQQSPSISAGSRAPMATPDRPPARAPAQPPPRPQASSPNKSAHTIALAGLVQRLVDVVDLDEADSGATDGKRAGVERVLREQARAMQQEGAIGGNVSIDDLVHDAAREALDVGVLDQLLDDADVHEVHATRFDQIIALREGGPAPVDPAFSTDATFRRALVRLASHRSLGPLGPVGSALDVRLGSGAQLAAVFPPVASNGTVAILRKQRKIEGGLDELVRTNVLSRPMATFLQSCLAAKSNILVSGPMGSGTSTVVAALAMGGPAEERVVALQDVDDVPIPRAASLLVPREGGAHVVHMAAALRPDRLVVGAMTGEIVGHIIETIGAGIDGVLAVVHGPSMRQSLARLAPALVAARPGLDAASARSWLAASFDLAIEVGRVRGGKYRVLRIAEVVGGDATEMKTKDVFELTPDAAGGEGTFNATGYVPNVAQELRAHGHRIDDSLFRRAR